MAITKETEIAKIEVVGTWNVQVATDTVIKEDGAEISRCQFSQLRKHCMFSDEFLIKLLIGGSRRIRKLSFYFRDAG